MMHIWLLVMYGTFAGRIVTNLLGLGWSPLVFSKGGCIGGYIECNLFVWFLDFVMGWQLFVGESSFPFSL